MRMYALGMSAVMQASAYASTVLKVANAKQQADSKALEESHTCNKSKLI